MKACLVMLLFHSITCSAEMVRIQKGWFVPILGKERRVEVSSFMIDETAVTNAQYLFFVKRNPAWRKSRVPRIFADSNYLKHWKGDDGFDSSSIDQSPVVNVSWFAAKAFCEWQGKRLPLVNEWEYLSQFGPQDGSENVKDIILEWYSQVSPNRLPGVRSTYKNKFGVWDVHGLIWEWTQDFNSSFTTGESRGDSALEQSMFCGGGAASAANPSDYAAFMRFGFRSSLQGKYTTENLGFRCAKEIE
mgnify:CR=1 FL=1